MEKNVKELVIGYDLCDDYIQISCYNQKTQDMDTICHIQDKNQYERIPTVMCRLYTDRSWVIGYDAWKAAKEGQGVLVEEFAAGMEEKKTVQVDDDTYPCAELVRIFIVNSLNDLVTKYYPHWCVGHLTISVRDLGKTTIEALKKISEEMDFPKDRLSLISHVSAYEYYALNQKKELWQYDVGMFDYSKRGMTYYHLNISKKRMPIGVMATTIPLIEYFDGSEIGQASPQELDRRFLEVIRDVTANRIISTVYLTGEGFEGDWAKISLKHLCHHRKGFIGSNIFSRGACYYGLMQKGILENDRFIALNEEVISKILYIRGTENRDVRNFEIVEAGESWYDVNKELTFIPDRMDHITIHIMDYLSRRERSIRIPLDAFAENIERPDRTKCLNMKISFDDFSHCHIQMEDMGFGEFFPATGKTMEMVFDIYDEELDEREIHEPGRILFDSDIVNTVPYCFGLSGIRVYSLNQLCYYVNNHIYTISLETFTDEFIYWIDRSLGKKTLALKLREGMRSGRSLKDMIWILMSYADYYTKEEVQELQEIIEKQETQNPIEIRKTEADNYLRYGRYVDALLTYKKVDCMMAGEDDVITDVFRSQVYHNMGIAFARLGNGEAAVRCFQQAYKLDPSEAVTESLLLILKILGRDEDIAELKEKVHISEEMTEEIDSRIYDAEQSFQIQPVYGMLEKIRKIQSEEDWDAVSGEVQNWLKKQKDEYRH